LFILVALAACQGGRAYRFRAGDVVFQSISNQQSEAIVLATGHEFSHCGIVFEQGGDFVVYEAVNPVKITPLQEWLDRGTDGKFAVRRIKNDDLMLSPDVMDRMTRAAGQHLGKSYDFNFMWSDDAMYCSEFVWKVYREAVGISLAELRPLKSYNLDHPTVAAKLQERYGDAIPYEELMVSPADLFTSDKLVTIYEN